MLCRQICGSITLIAHVVPSISFQKKSYARGQKWTLRGKNVARLFEVRPIKIGKFVLNRIRAALFFVREGLPHGGERVASPSRLLAALFRRNKDELVLCKKIQLL
ncbi:MAG TPA: hypothetical protein DCP92_02680 [Nitrospiraceae bacterium]|nr:hypothetical protein [Nitrospiraceae bacterium]